MEEGQLGQQLNLNTNGNCFFCFRPEREPYPSVHSNPRFPIQTLTGFLHIKPEVVERASQFPNLSSDNDNDYKIIAVSLCDSCLQLLTRIFQLIFVKRSSTGPLAEVTGMKLLYFLDKLRKTMSKVEVPSGKRNVGCDIPVAESLRKEIQKGCSALILRSLRNPRVLIRRLDPHWNLDRQQIKEERSEGGQDYEEDNPTSGFDFDPDPDSSPEPYTVTKVHTATEIIKTEPELEAGTPGEKRIAHQLQALVYEPSPTSGSDLFDREGDRSETKSTPAKLETGLKVSTKTRHNSGDQEIHNGNGVLYHCDQCDKRFRHKESLRRHKLRTHCGLNYPCDFSGCDKTYARKLSLKYHQGTVHGVPNAFFKAKKAHGNGKPIRKPQPNGSGFLCQECGTEFNNRNRYNLHYQQVHLGIRHKCSKCNRNFTQLEALKRHSLVSPCASGKPKAAVCSCPTCGREFARRKYLDMHVKFVHEEAPRFECDLCDKKFRFGYSLREHQNRVHFQMKFYCDMADCTKTASGKQAIIFHLINCHGVAPESAKDPYRECFGPHRCSVCQKRFPSVTSLQTHSRYFHPKPKNVPGFAALPPTPRAPREGHGKPSKLPSAIAEGGGGEEFDDLGLD